MSEVRAPISTVSVPVIESPSVEPDIADRLRRFIDRTSFTRGGFITDLDGTVVFETQGTTLLAPEVEHAIKLLYELGRPLMLNSLRFPLSVMRTFGADWYRLSNAAIPVVSLNGSQIGRIYEATPGELGFEELAAFPLDADEIDRVLRQVTSLVDGGLHDLLLFYYPRDWRLGEIIWTPTLERAEEARQRYRSASAVDVSDLDELRRRLTEREICMIFLLVQATDDVLMAYQHTKRSNFYTRAGVDKLSGAVELARQLDVDLFHSLGAGDTEMDRFLDGVGLALHVGPQVLPYRGKLDTIRVRDAGALASLLFHFAALQRESAGRAHDSSPSAASPSFPR